MSDQDSTPNSARKIKALTQESLREALHYDPLTGVFTWLKNIKSVKVGDVAGSRVTWGYWRIGFGGKAYKAHRLAWLYVHGWAPPAIDHIDGDKLNNRIANLREATPAMNAQNLVRANASNRSCGVLGVTKTRQGYQAGIQLSGKSKYLGTFGTPDEAHQAYLKAKRDMHPGCTI